MDKPKEDHIERKEVEEFLECTLTGVELLDRSKKLAKANNDAIDLDKKKKDVSSDFAAQQKKIDATLGILSRVVSSGKEYRTVKCEWVINYTKGVKDLVRLDTQDIIRTIDLTKEERQTKMKVG